MKTQRRRLMWHGMLLFFPGLITGFWPYCPEDGEVVFWNLHFVPNVLSLASGVSNHD